MKSKLIASTVRSFFRAFSFPLLLTVSISFFITSSAMAESWFVKPSNELPLRRGQGTDYKILAIVQDGTEVSIIEEDPPWVRITTQDNREGWVLKRYLSQEKPLKEIIAALQRQNSDLNEKNAAITSENEDLIGQNNILRQELDKCTSDLADYQKQYETLLNDTADVQHTMENLTQSKQTITGLQKKLDDVSKENTQLKANRDIQWFLTGGGTLIFGCIVGMLFSRSKRKRKSTLY